VPRTRRVLVDKEAVLALIDQLRVAVPEEIHAAKRINAESERIVEKAQDEASRIAARAQEQAAFLIGERGLTERADAEGRQIVSNAMEAADNVRLGADAYAADILGTLETEVRKALAGIEKGIDLLESRQAELRAPAQGDDATDDGLEGSAGDDGARPLDDWPAGEDESAFLRAEDAGQTVSR
jgi:hypothetical protein